MLVALDEDELSHVVILLPGGQASHYSRTSLDTRQTIAYLQRNSCYLLYCFYRAAWNADAD